VNSFRSLDLPVLSWRTDRKGAILERQMVSVGIPQIAKYRARSGCLKLEYLDSNVLQMQQLFRLRKIQVAVF
jgi:hypothetical protein